MPRWLNMDEPWNLFRLGHSGFRKFSDRIGSSRWRVNDCENQRVLSTPVLSVSGKQPLLWARDSRNGTVWPIAAPKFPAARASRTTDLGFYDLRVAETLDKQAPLLAASRGVKMRSASTLLVRTASVCLKSPWIACSPIRATVFRFLLLGNEKWTRSWDGMTSDVLIDQNYAEGFEETLADDLAPVFRGRERRTSRREAEIHHLPGRIQSPTCRHVSQT